MNVSVLECYKIIIKYLTPLFEMQDGNRQQQLDERDAAKALIKAGDSSDTCKKRKGITFCRSSVNGK